MAHLFLVRHGESEWNSLGLWTGWTDVNLAPNGIAEAKRAGELLRPYEIHSAHVSNLKRAQQTLDEIQTTLGRDFAIHIHPALNERHYGVYTGKNKFQVKEEIGEEAFQRIRRGWDEPIPEGETLEAVHARAVPYYENEILPELRSGKSVVIAAHGNTLRALIKHLEDVPVEEVPLLEVATGEIVAYEMTSDGITRLPSLGTRSAQ